MTRSTINATLLLLSILTLSACAKEGGKNSRTRVSGQTRMAKAGITPRQKQEAQNPNEKTNPNDISSEILCAPNTPELCNSIRTVIDDDGSINLTTGKTAQATDAPFKIEAGNDKTKEQTVSIPKAKVKNSKRVLYVLIASEGQNAKLDELANALKLPRTKVKRMTNIGHFLDAQDNTFRALLTDTNNHFLLVTTRLDDAAKLKKLFTDKIFDGRVTEQAVDAATEAYQLEARILEEIGSIVYLNYQLPVKKADLESVSLTVGSEQAQKETDFEIVDTQEGAVLRILNRSIIKNANDEIVIKFKAKAAATDDKAADDEKPVDPEDEA